MFSFGDAETYKEIFPFSDSSKSIWNTMHKIQLIKETTEVLHKQIVDL